MAKARTLHRCQQCSATTPQWAGRCPTCGEWNTLVAEDASPRRASHQSGEPGRAVPLPSVDVARAAPIPTGVDELDRVLAGGLVPGSVSVVGGEPGIGKSTLLLQAVTEVARRGRGALVVTAEESAAQVAARAARLGASSGDAWILAETSLPAVLAAFEEVRPAVAVVDSIQTVFDPEIPSAPGSVTQVTACAQQLSDAARRAGIALVLVGHVTKDGGLAGPRVLEHLVDSVLSFEGDRDSDLRLLRARKHRFGPTGELGVLEMTPDGLRTVADPATRLLPPRVADLPGSAAAAIVDGCRPLVVEVQALIGTDPVTAPRRSAQGLDGTRLNLLVAVLARRTDVRIGPLDVWASVAGGVRVTEPGVDLAVALAVASAATGRPVDRAVVAAGEVGLAGEVRPVPRLASRLSEAARLGFHRALVPAGVGDVEPPAGLQTVEVRTLDEALAAALGAVLRAG